ncbi:uncharacterized protein GGS22DRAFT_120403 [Annulohypoxylon maeteangense]|uniref:uncharacterized protein n=1 Tax=Annulohypoxylon maeteangense TaxID=1927788 RepID=UPI00200800EA|nr:uncharacterized protein GGS22DRAFT_120403 [Annulohypoxylon maeteangense]KAI0887009.1 hypothetical protein GGS22DRAFT_120403 [Annulohypoxylon maeteangense]
MYPSKQTNTESAGYGLLEAQNTSGPAMKTCSIRIPTWVCEKGFPLYLNNRYGTNLRYYPTTSVFRQECKNNAQALWNCSVCITHYPKPHFPLGIMSSNSNKAVYNGVNPPKPTHQFTRNPPTQDPVDKESLRNYHLRRYTSGSYSAPIAGITDSSSNSQGTRQESLAAKLNTILSHLG